MAILKHIASKNADYGKALQYLMFQHDEFLQKPLLDADGNMVLREEFHLEGINCDPYTFDAECEELNDRWKKNRDYSEIKTHHYIISFDPKDKDDTGLTGEWAQRLGMEYARKNFPGHQALVCTHPDGNNGTGNIHVHIIINSLRKLDVKHQDFMERPCDSRAGNKHHLTKKYLACLKQDIMDMCHREQFHQVDLLSPSEKKMVEKEYWAKRRGQKKLEQKNRQMLADGIIPRNTTYQTQKQFLRESIADAARTARSLEEFSKILLEKYNIACKESRGRFSYLHPEREKWITCRQLGTDFGKEHLLKLIGENIHDEKLSHAHPETESNTVELCDPRQAAQSSDLSPDVFSDILSVKSDLRLVKDLQQCIKAQQSRAYAQKVKLSNLKEMAKTVSYIQEHGYDTLDELESSFSAVSKQTASTLDTLKSTEKELKEINEQIHYTGQYLANKSLYAEFCRSKNKQKFRNENFPEISLYEEARKFLKEKSGDEKLPSIKLLKERKAKLMEQKKTNQEAYRHYRESKKELGTVRSNVDMILGNGTPRKPTRQKEHAISP